MTWLAKLMTIAWVTAEERRSWWFTVGSLVVLLGVVILSMVAGQHVYWDSFAGYREAAVYQAFGCILLFPALLAALKFGLEQLGDDVPEDLPLILPVWLMLLAGAVGGWCLHRSPLGLAVLGGCVLGTLACRRADFLCLRRRARVAEEIARGRLLTDPWDCEWYGKLADALLAQGKRAEAVKALQRWRVRDPWSCEPQQRLARIRVRPPMPVSLRPAAAAMLVVLLAGGALTAACVAADGVMRAVTGWSFLAPMGPHGLSA